MPDRVVHKSELDLISDLKDISRSDIIFEVYVFDILSNSATKIILESHRIQ